MDAGCLTDVLDRFPTLKLTVEQISYVSSSVLHGLAYMHNLHRIHRDIKSDNVFFVVFFSNYSYLFHSYFSKKMEP